MIKILLDIAHPKWMETFTLTILVAFTLSVMTGMAAWIILSKNEKD